MLAVCLILVYCLAYSSTLKMKAVCTFETSAPFYRTTRRYIPEDRLFIKINLLEEVYMGRADDHGEVIVLMPEEIMLFLKTRCTEGKPTTSFLRTL
jgi:hypothetical protein